MEVGDVLTVLDAFSRAGVWWCLQGGWGVDALLGVVTRPHKDLDVMVTVPSVDAVERALRKRGYTFAYRWPEDVAVEYSGREVHTAFVFGHSAGHEVDVHAGWLLRDGGIRAGWESGWEFAPEDVSAVGSIAGRSVRCMSIAAQLRAHEGYELPATHVRDVELLRATAAQRGS